MEKWLVPLRADQEFGSYLGNDVDQVFAEGEFQPLHAPVLALYPGGYEFMGETVEWKQDGDGRKLAAILVRTQEEGKLAFPNVRPKIITWEQFGLHSLLAVEGEVTELCPPLAEKMRELSGMDTSAKTAFIIDSAPDALLACNCGGLPEMRSAIWHSFSRSILQWGLSIDIYTEPAVHTISVDGDTSWADATKDLLSLAAEEPPSVSLQVR